MVQLSSLLADFAEARFSQGIVYMPERAENQSCRSHYEQRDVKRPAKV